MQEEVTKGEAQPQFSALLSVFLQILPPCDTKVSRITSFKGPILCQNLLEDLEQNMRPLRFPPSRACIPVYLTLHPHTATLQSKVVVLIFNLSPQAPRRRQRLAGVAPPFLCF